MPNAKSRRLAPAASEIGPNDTQKPRKNVGTACLACKARKLKCTGAPPCANCVKSRLECNLDETADKRRRGTLKRKIDQLEDKEDLLIRLVTVLRESSNRLAVPLLNLIRSNASLSEIRFYIERQLPRLELTHTPELVDVCRQVKQREPSEPLPKRRFVEAKRLSEGLRFSVPARPWTSVVTDDTLVSHLVSLWFTWVHPFCNWIDRDLFIHDMKSGSPSASYCSPFLVNTILADACAYSDHPAVCGVPGDIASRAAHFHEEAKRFLDKQEGRITLPTVQGLGVLWMCASFTGRDRQSWIRGGQLAYSLEELAQDYAESTTCMAREINKTNWGLFNLAMMHALSDRKAPVVKPPLKSSIPAASCESGEDKWCSYPSQSKDIHAHTLCLFNALCNLNRIAYELNPLFQTPSQLDMADERLESLRALREWHERLPECLKESNVDVPHVLSLHMHYHAIITTLYGHLRAQPIYTMDHATNRDATISQVHARDVCLSSARHIAQLTLVYRANWGFDHMSGTSIRWITAALFTLLEGLDDPADLDAFVSLAIAARAFSRRWGCMKGLLRTIQATAQQRGITLPAEVDPLFVDSDTTEMKSETPETAT